MPVVRLHRNDSRYFVVNIFTPTPLKTSGRIIMSILKRKYQIKNYFNN